MRGQLMRSEMDQQAKVLTDLSATRRENVDLVRRIAPRQLAGVLLVARGSSDNAALHARYLLELTTGKPTGLVAPSLWTRYQTTTTLSGWVAVAISQSGRTPEIIDTVKKMRSAGATILTVTNDERSQLADESDGVVALRAGQEVAIPATKTVTASILALTHVAAGLGRLPWGAPDEHVLSTHVSHVLGDLQPVERAIDVVTDRETVHVGRGYTFAVAMESALKFEETTTRGARGYACGDLLHGPVAAVGRQTALIGYAATGPTYDDVTDVLSMPLRGARTVLVTDNTPRLASSQDPVCVAVPRGLPEPLTAILLMVRAQQFAYLTAMRAGLDPDRPAGLNKVTGTG